MIDWVAAVLTLGSVWLYSRDMVTYGNWVQVVASSCWIAFAINTGLPSTFAVNLAMFAIAVSGLMKGSK